MNVVNHLKLKGNRKVYIMFDDFKKMLSFLEKVNTETNIVSKNDLDEQYKNLNDLKDLINEFELLLNSLSTIDISKKDKVDEILGEFHRILTTFEWHVSELSELNIEIYKNFED